MAALEDYYGRVSARLGTLPGVTSVGAIQFLPMTPGGWWTSYRPEGLALAEGENQPNTAMRTRSSRWTARRSWLRA